MIECSPHRARSSMAEQWPFKPLVGGSSPLALITEPELPGTSSPFSEAFPKDHSNIILILYIQKMERLIKYLSILGSPRYQAGVCH